MIFNRPRAKTKPAKLTIELGGSFDNSYGYVTIDGTKYTSAQTVEVESGASVFVRCGTATAFFQTFCKITLNGAEVAAGTWDTAGAAKYTFAATDNCKIVMTKNTNMGNPYYTAAITMPA